MGLELVLAKFDEIGEGHTTQNGGVSPDSQGWWRLLRFGNRYRKNNLRLKVGHTTQP